MPITLSFGLTGGAIIGTDGLIGAVINVLKMAMFGGLDLLGLELFLAGVLICLTTIPGAFAAGWIVDRLNVTLHTAIIEAIVLSAGLWLVLDGIVD